MSDFTLDAQKAQQKRVAILTTPLGPDKLALTRFEGYEGVSELFEFRIDAVSSDANINFDDALGRPCNVEVTTHKDPKRIFNGLLVEAQALGSNHELFGYRLILRPTLWLLSRRANCRIWHEKTALDIIKEVLGEHSVDHRSATTGSCRNREYTVQYRETDLAFVCRLMEEEGIYYFHEFSAGSHKLVLADAPSSHKPVPGLSGLRYSTIQSGGQVREEAIFEWTSERRFRSGKFELRDYNFKTPGNELKGEGGASAAYTNSKIEVYDYPGRHEVEADGKNYAEIRRDAEQALDKRRYAAGEAPSLFSGGLVTIHEHPQKSENKEYLILRATHSFSSQAYRSGSSLADERYRGTYELLEKSIKFRCPAVTPRALVHGPQTAKVVGKSGEEIDVDEHGRILVKFHWDRNEKGESRNESCRVRVAQVWAGKGWGGQFIPRIGMEVVVEFLEGDPDRPLVVGAVYNADNKYPWTLPDNKTQSGVKSDSSTGHGGYNQWRFEDKKGKEQIEIHAEKDHDVIVKDTETWKIGSDFTAHEGPESRYATLYKGDDRLDVQSGNQKVHIKQNQTIDVDQEIKITAQTKITITVGASKITMDPTSIKIESTEITISATGKVDMTALNTNINGDAVTTIKGGMVKIN